MKIYLIRHGETDWNLEQRLQGATDIPLNENGLELARETAQGLKEVPFDLIYTSPLKRAKQTAEILRGERDIPLIEEPRIREICFGIYEGYCCSREHYTIPDPAFMNFFVDPGNYIPPEGGESIEQLCRRTTDFLHEEYAYCSIQCGLCGQHHSGFQPWRGGQRLAQQPDCNRQERFLERRRP